MTPRYRVADDSAAVYKDFRGMPVHDLEQLKAAEIATLRTGDMKDGEPVLRMLTFEQVRMMRDLWVFGAIQDGFTETIELAYAILADNGRSKVVNIGPRELFLCEPSDDSYVSVDSTLVATDEEARVARTLGGALMRLARAGHANVPGIVLA